ncbi:MAG: hypothetical protein ACTHK0_15375 [Ginsengibacter sp.]
MKSTLLLLLLSVATSLYAQDSTLVQVSAVKPFAKQQMNFEKNVKTHVQKFHPKNYPLYVYQVMSGERFGSYFLVNPMASWAFLDKPRPDYIAHEQDILNSLTPWLMEDASRDYFRFIDSLSHSTRVNTNSLLFTTYYLKPDKKDEFLLQVRRGVLINDKINGISNYRVYEKQLSNFAPVYVAISSLKNGYSELEPEYMSDHNQQFKDTYIQMYGQDEWNKRMTLLPVLCDKVETELVKFRPDLSTKN